MISKGRVRRRFRILGHAYARARLYYESNYMSDSAYCLPLGLLSPTYRAKSAFVGVLPKGVPEGKKREGATSEASFTKTEVTNGRQKGRGQETGRGEPSLTR